MPLQHKKNDVFAHFTDSNNYLTLNTYCSAPKVIHPASISLNLLANLRFLSTGNVKNSLLALSVKSLAWEYNTIKHNDFSS